METLNRLMEHRNFPRLISLIRIYSQDTVAMGVMTQLIDMATTSLSDLMKEHPENRAEARQELQFLNAQNGAGGRGNAVYPRQADRSAARDDADARRRDCSRPAGSRQSGPDTSSARTVCPFCWAGKGMPPRTTPSSGGWIPTRNSSRSCSAPERNSLPPPLFLPPSGGAGASRNPPEGGNHICKVTLWTTLCAVPVPGFACEQGLRRFAHG